MLILSASFLAVQLWSEDAFRGAAEALEAPMLPPALPVGKKAGSKAALDKKIEQAKAAVAVEVVSAPEVQEPATEEPVAAAEPVVVEPVKATAMVEAPAMPADAAATAPAKAREVVVEAKASLKKPAKAIVEVKPAKVETVAVKEAGKKNLEQVKPLSEAVVVISKPSVVTLESSSVSTAVSGKSVTGSGKKIRGSRKAAREIDENEIPPEWNWFSTPLKLEFSGGNVEIVPVGKPRDIQLVSIVARLPSDPSVYEAEPFSGPSDETGEAQKIAVPATDKPFVSALARMAKLRYVRMAAVDADPELKKAAAAAHRSRSLEELRLAVAGLRSRLETGASDSDSVAVGPVASVAASEVSVETDSYVTAPDIKPLSDDVDVASASPSSIEAPEEPVVAADVDEKAEFKFVPYYSGSGSAMSSRINTLLQRGIGYSRR